MFDKIKNWFSKSAAATTDRGGWFFNWPTGGPTAAGVRITNNNALTIAAVFACIDCISADIAKLPLHIYKRDGKYRKKQYDHRLHRLLNYQPNEEMTAVDFRQAMTAHVLGWGNAYAEKQTDTRGNIIALWPLRPDRTVPFRDDNKKLFYEVTTDAGGKVYFPAHDILHIHGLSFDGLLGYNVISQAKESLGLAKATEKFGSSWFGNGAHPSGTLEHPETLSDKALTNLKKTLNDYKGTDKANKLLVLEEGMKFNAITVAPGESQFLETRKFSVTEICRWFRMKPHKIADLERATFTNIEHQNLEYVMDTLSTWFVRWEQALYAKLLTDKEKQEGFYFKHNANAIIRGDIKTRYEAFHLAINDGWLSRNQARELEDMNPEDGLDEFLLPLNMETLDRNAKIRQLEERARTDPAAAQQLEEMKFKRDLVKAFLADKTTNDVLFNMTDAKELLHEAGVVSNPKYEEPWLPVITKEGPKVSGEVKTDSEGDIVGGDTVQGQGSGVAGQGSDEDGSQKPDDEAVGAVIDDAADRIAASEIRKISARADKAARNREKFNLWVESFYQGHKKYIDRAVTPLIKIGGAGPDERKIIVDAIVGSAISQITAADDVPALLAGWEKQRAIQIKEIIEAQL